MSTLKETISDISEKATQISKNKVTNFAYTSEAYNNNDADGVTEYDINKAQNIPTKDASILETNKTVLEKGFRETASSNIRMLMNHFLGRVSYNLNKAFDTFKSFCESLVSYLGQANGLATLDENAKIGEEQLPSTTAVYRGFWDASTNTPHLEDGNGSLFDFYVVSVAGTQTFNGEEIYFKQDDRIQYQDSKWVQVSAGSVLSVSSVQVVQADLDHNVTLYGTNIVTDRTSTSTGVVVDTKKIKNNIKQTITKAIGQKYIGLSFASTNLVDISFYSIYPQYFSVTKMTNYTIYHTVKTDGCYYSYDGAYWYACKNIDGTVYEIRHDNGFIACTTSGIYYSSNGISWSKATITDASGGTVTNVTFYKSIYYKKKGYFFAISNDGFYSASSKSSWELLYRFTTYSTITYDKVKTYLINEKVFIVVQDTKQGVDVANTDSPPGLDTVLTGYTYYSDMVYFNGKYIISCSSSNGSAIFSSTDGKTFTQTSYAYSISQWLTVEDRILFGVVTKSSDASIVYTTDGTTFEVISTETFQNLDIAKISYALGYLIVITDTVVYVSNDLQNFTNVFESAFHLRDIFYCNGLVYFVGSPSYYCTRDFKTFTKCLQTSFSTLRLMTNELCLLTNNGTLYYSNADALIEKGELDLYFGEQEK